ncbi:hypothetical protein ACVILK_003158 [Bradyrhizobium embrapense]
MQGVLRGRQVSFLRVSPVARLARRSSVPSIQVRWTSSTRLIRPRAVISRGHLLARLFCVARRPRSRRRRKTEDGIRDSNSQDGEETVTLLSAESRRPMSELRRSSSAPPSWPTCSVSLEPQSSTFRISSCSTVRQSQASFGQHGRSSPFNLSRADIVIHSWLASPAGLPRAIGAAAADTDHQTNDNAVIACLASASSASGIPAFDRTIIAP